jgi:hypothetical protein
MGMASVTKSVGSFPGRLGIVDHRLDRGDGLVAFGLELLAPSRFSDSPHARES